MNDIITVLKAKYCSLHSALAVHLHCNINLGKIVQIVFLFQHLACHKYDHVILSSTVDSNKKRFLKCGRFVRRDIGCNKDRSKNS